MTQDIPSALWIPGRSPSVYSGTPLEIVTAMGAEMACGLSIRETIGLLLEALAENRRVIIGLPADAPDEDLARLFIESLLDTGLARPMDAA